MANMTRYDAKDCTVTVNNVYITGLGETMVSGEKDEEFFTSAVGAQGDIVVSANSNEMGTVTVTIQSTSPQKSMLMNLAKNEETFPVWIVNKSLGERFGGSMARLKKYPSMERGKENSDMGFEFTVFDYVVEAL